MGKAKKANQQQKPNVADAKAIKEGQIHKNKAQKFKQTPTGKVAIINGNNKANGAPKNQKNNKPVVNKQSPSPQKNQKNQQKSPKGGSPKKPVQKKNQQLKKKEEEKEEDSDEDINEGISIKEDVSLNDEEDESSEEEVATANLLGESLANDSDEDDEDFEGDDDDDEDEEEEVNKGVKKFKGSKNISNEEEDDDDDDEEEDDDDDDDDDDEEVQSAPSSLNSSAVTDEDDEDDDDDDEDDDDDDDDDDEDEDGPGLKDLLGESLVDQDDDEDFNGEGEDDDDDEDEDISEEEESQDEKNQSKDSTRFNDSKDSKESPRKLLTPEEKAERDARTIFIGNVPTDLEEKVLRETFKKYGPIETVRIRGIIPESPKMNKKVAAIKKKLHPSCKAVCVYIVFKKPESAEKALEQNGQKLGGNWIRVDKIGQDRQADPKKSVFVGNVPFDVHDNDLWELFKDCGKIDYVRTVRDRFTGCCRGMAYVNFVEEDGATLALNLNGSTLSKRELRVSRYDPKKRTSPQANGAGQKRPFAGKQQNSSPKKQKVSDVEKATTNSINAEKRIGKKQKPGFQGQKAQGKKQGKKETKFDKKKKNMAAKLLAKPKKAKAQ